MNFILLPKLKYILDNTQNQCANSSHISVMVINEMENIANEKR